MNKPRKDYLAFDLAEVPQKETKHEAIFGTVSQGGLGPNAHRETVTKVAEGEGGFGHCHVAVRIEPKERSTGNEVLGYDSGSPIPAEFIRSAMEGIREGLQNGVVAGYPVVDVAVQIVGGSFHEKHSTELAFKMVGIFAVKAAMKKAHPILVE